MNVSALWMILATSAGVLIGLFTIRGDGRLAALLCAAGLALIAVWIIVRHAPVHSFDWSPVRRVERIVISLPYGGGQIEISDRESVDEFIRLGSRGHYETITKSGGPFAVSLDDGTNSRNMMVGYECLYEFQLPADAVQTVFVPSDQLGLRRWLERALERKARRSPP